LAYTIVIDAGHGGTTDPGAVYQGRQEKDDNLRLALAVGNILEQNGQNVVFTRTTDVYQTPFEKAQIANNAGADYFISIHRNSSPQPNQYTGVESLIYDMSGNKLAMAESINREMENVGFRNIGVTARPGLVVLRRTQMPAILVEAGFLNSDADNALFDAQFDQIAQAIGSGILETLSPQTDMNEEPGLYRVQVGMFRVKGNAENLLYELLDRGYPAFILQDGEFYEVQVGAFRQLDNAVRMEQQLRSDGYSTWITV